MRHGVYVTSLVFDIMVSGPWQQHVFDENRSRMNATLYRFETSPVDGKKDSVQGQHCGERVGASGATHDPRRVSIHSDVERRRGSQLTSRGSEDSRIFRSSLWWPPSARKVHEHRRNIRRQHAYEFLCIEMSGGLANSGDHVETG